MSFERVEERDRVEHDESVLMKTIDTAHTNGESSRAYRSQTADEQRIRCHGEQARGAEFEKTCTEITTYAS